MATRLFKYLTVPELRELAISLSKALTTGQTQELRNNNTGFLRVTGAISGSELRNRLMDVRYEIYLRGVDGDTVCAGLEGSNPFRERVMRVESTNLPPTLISAAYGA